MRTAALLAAVAVAACGSDEPLPKGDLAIDVTHYDYTFDLTTRAAHTTVTGTVATAGDCWTIANRAQDTANLEINGGDLVSGTIEDNQVTACGKGYQAGATITLDADVTVPAEVLTGLQVGYSTKTDTAGNAFTYMLAWVGGCDRFGPCDSAPDKFATYTFDVTHAAGTTVRCPGDVTDVSPTETVCDFHYAGGPTYSTWGIAGYTAWTPTDLGQWGDVHVTIYDRPTTGITARIDPTYHTRYLAWLESQFGPYPYGSELRLLTAPTVFAGFEHPGNIVLLDSLAHTKALVSDYVQHTLDHEMAHMWAGDQTTIADVWSFAWKEATVEWLASTWEDMQDPAVSLRTRGSWKSDSTNPAPKFYPVPLEHPAIEDFWGDVYGPAPMILYRQVEVMTSRDQVLAALHDVLGTQRALSMDELVAALEQHTGLPESYFDGWLRGTGAPSWPKLDVTFTAGSGATSALAIHQSNPGPKPQGCKFHVELDGANPGESALAAIDTYTTPGDQNLQVPTPAFTVVNVVLDPLDECLVFPGNLSPSL